MAAKPAGKATEAIPVLIRLPRLVVDPEPSEACSAPDDEAEVRATIRLQARDQEHSLPFLDDARQITDAMVVGKSAGAPPQLHLLESETSPWIKFRYPRWAVRAGIALGLIAVLVLAFSAIRGSSEKSDNVAEFEAVDSLPVAGIPAPEMPPLPSSLPELPPPAPTAETAVQSGAAATASRAADNAKQQPASADRTSAPSAVSQSKKEKHSPTSSEPQAPVPPLLESPVSKMAAPPADSAPAIPAAAIPPATTEPKTAETTRADANLPLTAGPAGTGPSTSADLHRYPDTNPTTFQYPVDYHLRLRNQARAPARETDETGPGGPIFNGPTGSAAANGWQPNTARLQPRIEPPPVR